jgi:ADP-heptose:LPS heptosyltransferase
MFGTIAYELKKKCPLIIEVNCSYPELLKCNPSIDIVSSSARRRAFLLKKLPKNKAISPKYWFGEGNQPSNHILKLLCEQAGISGEIDFRTYIHLTRNELEQVPYFMRGGIVIQSQGKLSWGINKNWYPDRFQDVVNHFKAILPVIQIGTSKDPLLSGCIDMRDRTSLRSAAAILYWSRCFVGQVGGLMHLARAVDTKSVIIYGGFEKPWQSGYDNNFNITSKVDCSPCWKMQECLPRKCMDNISSQEVIEAVEKLFE